MHAIKASWSGEIFALAAGNDSGGRKSRIRRSKEERKEMVENFIEKYQKSNNGNFPSLNLTHKEVGGSFYTVREIVREIIQENRVLAPPKVLLEDSGFLEQHPLGSISMEPQMELLASDRIHMATHSAIDKYQITSEENISNFSVEFHKSSWLESENEQMSGVSGMVEREENSDVTSGSHYASNHYQDTSIEEVANFSEQSAQLESLENEKIVDGVEVFEENLQSDSDKPVSIDVMEQRLNNTDQIVDKTIEFRQRIFLESEFVETVGREKNEVEDVDASRTATSHVNSNIVVEKFPLRPVPWTIHDVMDRGSGEVGKLSVQMKHESCQHDQIIVQKSSDSVNVNDETVLLSSSGKSNGKSEDEKMVLNLEDPPVSDNCTSVGRKCNDPDKSNNPNLETSTKSARPENNPLVAFLKGIVSSFIKFWTE